MTILGVELQRPTFGSLTAAVALGVLLWALLTASPVGSPTPVAAGANLAAILFGCVSNAIGIDIKKGGRHLVLNIAGCTLVLVTYHLVAALV